jgi:hypothetical protein
VHPPANHQQQREELTRKEESRREEFAKKTLEVQLEAFDAYKFYENLRQWAAKPIPKPTMHCVHITPVRKEEVVQQPCPITNKDLTAMHTISSDCARLLYLLRSLDEKGMECPYIHLQNQNCLHMAIDRCNRLQKAGIDYLQSTGLWSWVTALFRKSHFNLVKKDLESFKNRLEAIQILCRHQEFAQDLQKMKAAVTYRSMGATPVKTPVRAIHVPAALQPKEKTTPSQLTRCTNDFSERYQTIDQS